MSWKADMNTLLAKSHEQLLWPVTLEYSGKVLVGIGEMLTTGQPVAEITLPDHFQVFDLVSSYRIHPSETDQYLRRLVGETVQAGDIVAQKPGLVTKIFRAPQAGRVVSIRDGKVTLALGERKHQALAPFPGEVVELIPGRGVVIALHAAVLQGVWGNGIAGKGPLIAWDEAKSAASMSGSLVYFEQAPSIARLRRLLDAGAGGLVFTAILPEHWDFLQKIKVPVLSLMGFGNLHLDAHSKKVLNAILSRPDVPVSLMNLDRHANYGRRPLLIQPLETSIEPVQFTLVPEQKTGREVRLIGQPHSGQLAEVIALPLLPEQFESGLVLMPAVVQLSDGAELRVPLDNLEWIEE
jgi:hypothetical protein